MEHSDDILKKNILSCFYCHKTYTLYDVKEQKSNIHCPSCYDVHTQNLERLQKMMNNDEKKEEEKKEKLECDNSNCIIDPDSLDKLYTVGCYEFCLDCFFAIGRKIAREGI